MKHLIIGTAGHIDHGKTTLIKALTGRNTDRWEEEQRRGITIDLGFTYFDLPSGDRVGIIDVPGHEKFIPNMVAGVAGMDLVLLVVAADEGIMPQTREHMDILSLLGIEKSIVVLNKCDLVEEEWLDLMEEEIREELSATFLANAPIVRVSAATGLGLSALTERIARMTEGEVQERDVQTVPRLPVDRVFNISGFGTIITGTLLSGTIRKEDSLEIYPLNKPCKIRSIQVHDSDVPVCYAGQRVAINISNVKKSELKRGAVLSAPNSMRNTDLLDVRLSVLPSSERILTNHSRLHFFTGTAEVLVRAVLLDKEEIGPGESGYVQLRLEETMALRRGDSFVVRFYSPMETIGGGVVLEPNPTRKKRFQEKVIEELRRKEAGTSADVLELLVLEQAETMVSVAELAKKTVAALSEVEADIAELEARQAVLTFPMKRDVYAWHCESERKMRRLLTEAIGAYHEKYPYRPGVNKAELQTTFMKKVRPNVFDLYMGFLEDNGVLHRYEEYLALADYCLIKDNVYLRTEARILSALKEAHYDFVKFSDIPGLPEEAPDILANLLKEGRVIRVAEDLYTLSDYMDTAKERIGECLRRDGIITIAQVRDMFSTSRKSAKPLLEYMDSVKISKKTGAESERVAYNK